MSEKAINPLSGRQQARAAALAIARDVLSSSQLFGKSALDGKRGIDDLLNLSEWILDESNETRGESSDLVQVFAQGADGRLVPVAGVDIAAMLADAADKLPDCGHPNCPVHAPRRAVQDLDPEDAKSSFDPPVDEFQRASEVAQAEQDATTPVQDVYDPKYDEPKPPSASPDTYKVGTWLDTEAGVWQVVRALDGENKIWKQIPALPPSNGRNVDITPVHTTHTDDAGNEWVVKSDGAYGHKFWTTR